MEDKSRIVVHKKGPYEKYIKRPLDFLLSLISLMVLSPLILIIAILVRIKLGKPVVFKQLRPGLNGNIFAMYKFRSICANRFVERVKPCTSQNQGRAAQRKFWKHLQNIMQKAGLSGNRCICSRYTA